MKTQNSLKALRLENSLSQTDVAKIISRSQGSYSDIENGHTSPDIDTLEMLANYYHCSIDYLIGRENEDGTIIIEGEHLSSDERQLLGEFRALNSHQKNALLILLSAFRKD